MYRHPYRVLLFPEVSEGGGSVAATPSKAADPQAGNVADSAERFERMLDRDGGDLKKLALRLNKDNYRQREEIRQLKGKLPGDGAVILKPDEAKAWSEYLKLGKAEDLKGRLDKGDLAHGELARREQAEFHTRVAEALGWKPSLTSDVLAKHKLTPELKDEVRAGQTVKVPYVKDGDRIVTLADFVKDKDADYLDVLPSGSKVEPRRTAGTPRPYSPNTPAPRPGADDPLKEAYDDYKRSGAAAF